MHPGVGDEMDPIEFGRELGFQLGAGPAVDHEPGLDATPTEAPKDVKR